MSMYIVAEQDKGSGEVVLHVQGYDTTDDILNAFYEYIMMCDQDDEALADILRNEAAQLESAMHSWTGKCQLEVRTDTKTYYIRQI